MNVTRQKRREKEGMREKEGFAQTHISITGGSFNGRGGLGRPVTDGQAETASARGHGTEMALHVKFHDEGSRAFSPMTGCSDLIALYQPSQIGAPKAFHGRAVPVQDIPQ